MRQAAAGPSFSHHVMQRAPAAALAAGEGEVRPGQEPAQRRARTRGQTFQRLSLPVEHTRIGA